MNSSKEKNNTTSEIVSTSERCLQSSVHTADCMQAGGGVSEGVVTRFTGREGPHRLGANLPNRPGPLQLLRVSSRWCLARCRHTLKQKNTSSAHSDGKSDAFFSKGSWRPVT